MPSRPRAAFASRLVFSRLFSSPALLGLLLAAPVAGCSSEDDGGPVLAAAAAAGQAQAGAGGLGGAANGGAAGNAGGPVSGAAASAGMPGGQAGLGGVGATGGAGAAAAAGASGAGEAGSPDVGQTGGSGAAGAEAAGGMAGMAGMAGAEAVGGMAGMAGMAGAGTGDGDFHPCPSDEPCKILPLGDSITFGLNFDGGYRVELFRLAVEAGHDVTFTGTQAPNGPAMVAGLPFPKNHEGISGETIVQIDNRVPSPALNDMPHIVLLHAGTNDMVGNAAGADGRLATLLDDLIAEAPDALIVVSSIIPLSFGAGSLDGFNAAIPGIVEERANAGAHILYVDQFDGFPTSELGDGVHPNEAGYNRMAQVWFDAISGYLP